jgi:hypothetical protein
MAEDEFLKPEMPESVRNLLVPLYARRRNKIGL